MIYEAIHVSIARIAGKVSFGVRTNRVEGNDKKISPSRAALLDADLLLVLLYATLQEVQFPRGERTIQVFQGTLRVRIHSKRNQPPPPQGEKSQVENGKNPAKSLRNVGCLGKTSVGKICYLESSRLQAR